MNQRLEIPVHDLFSMEESLLYERMDKTGCHQPGMPTSF
jgi:hypothetical protein